MHVLWMMGRARRNAPFRRDAHVSIPIYTLAGIFHRFFSHQAYACSRLTAFCLGLYSTLLAQRGPMWWSSKHIRHHKVRKGWLTNSTRRRACALTVMVS